jgi:hypothetical protein
VVLTVRGLHKQYSSRAPSQYLVSAKNPNLAEVLRSHLIAESETSGLLQDDFETFVQYRAGEILKIVRRLTGEMTEIQAELEEDERAVLDRFERRLRDLVDGALRARDPQYWQGTGTDDFREKIEQRIAQWLNESPGRSREDVREIDFFQIFDYLKVIRAHWAIFESVFRSKSDLEQYFKILSKFRNALAHSRTTDEATRQLALGALIWFDQALAGTDAKKLLPTPHQVSAA